MSNKQKYKNPNRNNEGYIDPTPYMAIRNVSNQEDKEHKKAMNIVNTIKNILEHSGYELVERIAIKNKKSKKIYK